MSAHAADGRSATFCHEHLQEKHNLPLTARTSEGRPESATEVLEFELSHMVDIDYGLGKIIRIFLRNVVAKAGKDSMLVFA